MKLHYLIKNDGKDQDFIDFDDLKPEDEIKIAKNAPNEDKDHDSLLTYIHQLDKESKLTKIGVEKHIEESVHEKEMTESFEEDIEMIHDLTKSIQ